jgi:hypothetical protein
MHLLQGQATKVSWLLWTAAILFFLTGLALLIYLMTRGKGADQLDELEDHGGGGLLSRERLLDEMDEKKSEAQDAPPVQGAARSVKEEEADAKQTIPLSSEADFNRKVDYRSATTSRKSDPASSVEPETLLSPVFEETLEEELPPVQTVPEPETEPARAAEAALVPDMPAPEIQEEVEADAAPAVSLPLIEPPPVIEERGTQFLASPPTPTVEAKPLPVAAHEEPIFSPQEEALFSQKETLLTQANSSVRVDAPASPQRLEQAAAFSREPFEPPTIEPIMPQQTATQQLSSPANISKIDERRQVETTALSSQPSHKQTVRSEEEVLQGPQIHSPADSGTLPLSSAQTGFPSAPQMKGQAAPMWEAQGAGTHATKGKTAGSVLGLPAETSHAPLILGKPSRDRGGEGVAALSNYDKDLDAAETGRGGAIALLVAILLIGGAALAYFFIPSVQSRADALVARIRGQQTAPAPVEKPKAQVYPLRNPEVIKNLVKARGSVTNISEEALEELSVEVSLDRGEGTAAEVRTIPVNPSVLAPRQQGQYEFEYEGGKATGFSRYRVTKLLSKNGEVKFTTPSQ